MEVQDSGGLKFMATHEGDFLFIIATAIKCQLENDEDFYDEIIAVLTDNPQLLTFGIPIKQFFWT